MTKNAPPSNPISSIPTRLLNPALSIPPPLPIRLITHNIRYAITRPTHNEPPWSTRLPLLCAQLHFTTVASPSAFICLQEVLHSQLVSVVSTLNTLSSTSTSSSSPSSSSPWHSIGHARDDGHQLGEYSPILYRPSHWTLLRTRTLWLSPTPQKPSFGWDAACRRVVTLGHFEHRETRRRVLVLNTHFDHVGVRAREESARLLLRIVEEEREGGAGEEGGDGAEEEGREMEGEGDGTQAGKSPEAILLTGDFNSPPEDIAYRIMTAPESSMADLRGEVEKSRRWGDEMTFTGFSKRDGGMSRIDFVFVGKEALGMGRGRGGTEGDRSGKVKVEAYAVLPNSFDDGVLVSDHRAVVGDVCLTG